MAIDPRLEQEVTALGGLSRDDLAARWIKTYGCPPPSGVRRELLLRAAAWHLQAKRIGGYSTETKKRLAEAMRRSGICGAGKMPGSLPAIAESVDSGDFGKAARTPTEVLGDEKDARMASKSRRSVSKGARLLLDWNGKTHVVDVTAEGFLFEGKLYRSLSAIAREITGAHWSGPRFFGL